MDDLHQVSMKCEELARRARVLNMAWNAMLSEHSSLGEAEDEVRLLGYIFLDIIEQESADLARNAHAAHLARRRAA